MTETTEPDLPHSRRRITRMPGLVWAVPLAALLVVGYLGIHAWAERGVIVTVTFHRAADARPHDTKVLYQGVEAGELIKILPNENGRRLDFKLRLIPAAKPGLNSNARFWLIGGSPNLSDISSLKSLCPELPSAMPRAREANPPALSTAWKQRRSYCLATKERITA